MFDLENWLRNVTDRVSDIVNQLPGLSENEASRSALDEVLSDLRQNLAELYGSKY